MGGTSSGGRAECVQTSESNSPDESGVFINSIRLTENAGHPIVTFRCQPDSRTTIAVLDHCAAIFPDRDVYGERAILADGSCGKYLWQSFSQFRAKCIQFAAAIQSLSIPAKSTIGILSRNCTAWQIVHFGCHYSGAILVPINESLNCETVRYIIEHSECKLLVIHGRHAEQIPQIFGNGPQIPVVVISAVADDRWIPFDAFLQRGDKGAFTAYCPRPSDVAVLMYTYGPDTSPKGCVLTHENIIAGATGLTSAGAYLSISDTYFSFLPLAHIYELECQLTMLAHGVRTGFFSGEIRDLWKDINVLQPTILCGVPGIFNRLAEEIEEGIAQLSAPKRLLMNWAIRIKREALDSASEYSLFLDWLLFSQFRGKLGGRIRLIVSGGAPLLADVQGYLRAVTTPNIIQGYGATEIAAAGCVQEVGDGNPLTVGPVCISADLKFRRVPGMHYDPNATPPSGEVLFRGPSVFRGYHKDDTSTQEAFVDGWFASGDVGCLTSDGKLEIIDRVKQVLKLSQGEYISPETLSKWYSQTRSIRYIYVFADSHHSQPVAVVVPTETAIADWAARRISDITNSDTVRQEILKALDDKAEQLGLRHFEKILDVIVERVTFTPENGMLKESLEPHLPALRSKYEARLLELYDRHR